MDLRRFITLKTVVEEGSFLRASQKLCCTQSTVTFHIQQLEQEFSVQLFEKIGRRMCLTREGKKLLPHIYELTRVMDTLREAAKKESDPDGELRVVSGETLLSYRMPQVLQRFRQRAPKVRLSLQSLNCYVIRDALLNDEADVGVFYRVGNDDALNRRELGEQSLVLVASPQIADVDFTEPGRHNACSFIINEPQCVFRQIFESTLRQRRITVENTIELFEDDTSHGAKKLKSTTGSLDDPKIRELLGDELYENLCNDIELLDMAGDEFDMEKVNTGELTPMFFGSAMTNFGVQSFLEKFLEMSPMPQPRMLQDGTILSPENEKFSAFVFKIQANMNPAHRDRISFMRICSGVFDKGMSVYHKQSGKMVKLAQPQQFLAQERTIVEKAYPGDIIGVFDPGIFGIGDSLSDSSLKLQFEDFPVFPPEIFARVQPKDSLKRKQFEKGIIQLSQEGAIQVFRQEGVGLESWRFWNTVCLTSTALSC